MSTLPLQSISPVQLFHKQKTATTITTTKQHPTQEKAELGRRPGDSVISACITALWLIRTDQNRSLSSKGSFQTYSIKAVSEKQLRKKIKESFFYLFSPYSHLHFLPNILRFRELERNRITITHKSHQLQVLIYSVVVSVFSKTKFLKLRRKH